VAAHQPPDDQVSGDQVSDDQASHDQVPGDPEQQLGDPTEVARQICLRLLTGRPRTRGELATTLRRRGVPEEAARAVLDRFTEVGLVDDRAFAAAWVSSRQAGRGLARGALAAELRRKGVDAQLVDEAVGQVRPAAEEDAGRALVRRGLRRMDGVPVNAARRRLVGQLARRGYPAGLAARLVAEELRRHPQEGDGEPD